MNCDKTNEESPVKNKILINFSPVGITVLLPALAAIIGHKKPRFEFIFVPCRQHPCPLVTKNNFRGMIFRSDSILDRILDNLVACGSTCVLYIA